MREFTEPQQKYAAEVENREESPSALPINLFFILMLERVNTVRKMNM